MDVGGENLYFMHVRSSSSKETADFNLETMVLLQHKYDIYIWSEETKIKKIATMEEMTEVQTMDEGVYYF
jgi:hypothetical protein